MVDHLLLHYRYMVCINPVSILQCYPQEPRLAGINRNEHVTDTTTALAGTQQLSV